MPRPSPCPPRIAPTGRPRKSHTLNTERPDGRTSAMLRIAGRGGLGASRLHEAVFHCLLLLRLLRTRRVSPIDSPSPRDGGNGAVWAPPAAPVTTKCSVLTNERLP